MGGEKETVARVVSSLSQSSPLPLPYAGCTNSTSRTQIHFFWSLVSIFLLSAISCYFQGTSSSPEAVFAGQNTYCCLVWKSKDYFFCSVGKTTGTNRLKEAEQTLMQVCWQKDVCSYLCRVFRWWSWYRHLERLLWLPWRWLQEDLLISLGSFNLWELQMSCDANTSFLWGIPQLINLGQESESELQQRRLLLTPAYICGCKQHASQQGGA